MTTGRSRTRGVGLLLVAVTLAGCAGSSSSSDAPQRVGGSSTLPPPSIDRPEVPETDPASLPGCPSAEPVDGTDGTVGEADADSLPALTLPCLGEGADVDLADLRGPLVLNVWASWCAPCREEAPLLTGVQRQAGDRVAFLGVTLDSDMADARQGSAAFGLTFPSVLDERAAVRGPLNVLGPPYTFLVDASGSVVHVVPGALTSEQQLVDLVRDELGVAL